MATDWIVSFQPDQDYEDARVSYANGSDLLMTNDLQATSCSTRGPLLIVPTTPQRFSDISRLIEVRTRLYPESDLEISFGMAFLFVYFGKDQEAIFSISLPNLELSRSPFFQKILSSQRFVETESGVMSNGRNYDLGSLLLQSPQ